MKRLFFLAIIMLFAANVMGQKGSFYKITPDLLEEINQSSKSEDMLEVIIIMNDQFDAQKSEWQMKNLSKSERRSFVINELQQVANNGQKAILADLQVAQKASLVASVRPFWIINGIRCSMTKDMVLATAERADVKYIMKNLETHIIDGEVSENANEGRGTNQWNVLKVQADKVWEMGYTGSGVIVAVIDSGVNYNHTDIANNMWDGGVEYPHHGWDFVNDDNDPMDDKGHGTHCAGTVSSYGTNGKQCGIAKEATIMALKVLDNTGSGSSDFTWAAIEFAISHNADILSLSLGIDGIGGFWVERKIMENVLSCGVIASVAAGNTGNKLSDYPIPNNVGSPGNCPSPWHNPDQTLDGGRTAAVTVGATTSSDGHSAFSSFGPVTWSTGTYIGSYSDYPWADGNPINIGLIKPDIVAPGSDIYSLDFSNNTGYNSKQGTSMATPCVAGVMALMLQVDPSLTPMEIDSIIEVTAVACGGQSSKNNTFGAGRIDALAAVDYILKACEPPTNLAATIERSNVNLSWDAADNVSSYRLYRNGLLIAPSISGTSYIDTNVPAGNNTYYVRSIGNNNKTSMASNYVTASVTVNFESSTPTLTYSCSDSEINFSWEAPSQNQVLHYTDQYTGYTGIDESLFIAGQKFPSSMLRPYAGMQLDSISFYIQEADIECNVKVYEGDLSTPGELIHQGYVTSKATEEKVTYTPLSPIILNQNKDLWIVLSLTGKIAYDSEYTGDGGDFPLLYQHTFETGNTVWFRWVDGAWAIDLYLSNGDFAYNVFDNDVLLSSQQASTSYSIPLTAGIHSIQVSAVTNGFESPYSNNVTMVKGQQSLSELTIPTDEKLVISSMSTLTVTGEITNDDPANLIIEDGGQLIHPNSAVNATLKKTIEGYVNDGTGEEPADGWYTIASPTTAEVSIATIGEYDLYMYDEEQVKWLNQKSAANNINEFNVGQGLLYANAAQQSLPFAGSMRATNDQITVPLSYQSHNESLKGFNLLGNPFTRNLSLGDIIIGNTVLTTYYVVEGGSELETRAIATYPIKPGQGFLVQASASDQDLVFNPSSKAESATKPSYISLEVNNEGCIERTYLQIGQGNTLRKMTLSNNNSQFSLTKGNDNYAALTIEVPEDEIPVSFKAANNGTYTLNVNHENVGLDYLHLIDNIAGTDIDLLQNQSYTFEAKTNDYVSRFRLVFSATSNPFNDSDNINDGVTQIMDVTGRVVGTSINEHLKPGIYILRTVNGDETKTEKFIIK